MQTATVLGLVQPGGADLAGRQDRQEIHEARGADDLVTQPHHQRQFPPLTLLGDPLAIPVRPLRSVHVLQGLAIEVGQRHQLRDIGFHHGLQAQGASLQGDG
ncbi:hypothetical protein D3C80_1767620 [compost metagenome]